MVGVRPALGLASATDSARATAAVMLAPGTILLGLATLAVSLSVFLPFTIRFGLVWILTALVALQVLGMAVLALANRFGAHAGLRGVTREAIGWVARMHNALGEAVFFGATLLALAVLLAVSLRVSTWLFERKELWTAVSWQL